MVKYETFSKEWFAEIYAEKVKEKNDKLLKEEGCAEGYISGEKDGKLETAQNLLSVGMGVKDIIKVAELEEGDILNLQNKD